MFVRAAKPRHFGVVVSTVLAASACTGRTASPGDPTPGMAGSSPGAGGSGGSTGSVGAGGKDGGAAPDGGRGFDPGPCDPAASLAPARIWQLTDEEYLTALRGVFDISLAPGDGPSTEPPDSKGIFTDFSERRTMSAADVASYDRAAEAVALRAASKLTTLVPCAGASVDAGTDDGGAAAACVEAFLRKTGARAFRRPVSDEEVADWMALYRLAAATDGPAAGLGLVVQEIVMSPYFLFRTELGMDAATATTPVTLTPYELASALSFTFLGSGPDDALWDAAEAGTLADAAVLSGQVDRLMGLPETQANLTRRASYWLGTAALPLREKNATIFPEYTPELEHDLEQSAAAFVRDVLFEGKLGDLLESSTVYVNERMGGVYGLRAFGSEMTRLSVTVPERGAGILSQPATLAAVNRWGAVGDPVHRGIFVYDALLCGGDAGELPAAPNPPDSVAKLMAGSQRDEAAKRSKQACSGCHDLFDPIGLAFERYDAIGRYSETKYVYGDPLLDNALSWKTSSTPIDASAVLDSRLGAEIAGPMNGLADLAQKLKRAEKRIAFCGAKRLATYSLGYDPGTAASCSLRSAQDELYRTGSFVGMFRALATSPGFARRGPGK